MRWRGTWDLRLCRIDPNDLARKRRPEVLAFPETSTERAELEHFAEAALAGRPLVLPGGDAVHNVALLEAVLASARSQAPVRLS